MKTAIITGASRGIGREIAKKFAENNYNVVINYNKSEKEAKSLAKELEIFNVRTLTFKADIANEKEVQKMIDTSIKNFGNIDVLVNNAGISLSKLLQDCTSKDIQNIINTNVNGCIYATKFIAPHMISNKHGKIVNISSIWGVTGASMESVYSASKGAIISFTKAIAKELAPSNININCVCPGVIDTDMMKEYSEIDKKALIEATPLNRLGSTQDIANLVYFLSTEDANFITGQIITVDGGFNL